MKFFTIVYIWIITLTSILDDHPLVELPLYLYYHPLYDCPGPSSIKRDQAKYSEGEEWTEGGTAHSERG